MESHPVQTADACSSSAAGSAALIPRAVSLEHLAKDRTSKLSLSAASLRLHRLVAVALGLPGEVAGLRQKSRRRHPMDAGPAFLAVNRAVPDAQGSGADRATGRPGAGQPL